MRFKESRYVLKDETKYIWAQERDRNIKAQEVKNLNKVDMSSLAAEEKITNFHSYGK